MNNKLLIGVGIVLLLLFVAAIVLGGSDMFYGTAQDLLTKVNVRMTSGVTAVDLRVANGSFPGCKNNVEDNLLIIPSPGRCRFEVIDPVGLSQSIKIRVGGNVLAVKPAIDVTLEGGETTRLGGTASAGEIVELNIPRDGSLVVEGCFVGTSGTSCRLELIQ